MDKKWRLGGGGIFFLMRPNFPNGIARKLRTWKDAKRYML